MCNDAVHLLGDPISPKDGPVLIDISLGLGLVIIISKILARAQNTIGMYPPPPERARSTMGKGGLVIIYGCECDE